MMKFNSEVKHGSDIYMALCSVLHNNGEYESKSITNQTLRFNELIATLLVYL